MVGIFILVCGYFGYMGLLNLTGLGWIETAVLTAAIVGLLPFIESKTQSDEAKRFQALIPHTHPAMGWVVGIFLATCFVLYLIIKPATTIQLDSSLQFMGDLISFSLAAMFTVPLLTAASMIADHVFGIYGPILERLEGPHGAGGGGGSAPDTLSQAAETEPSFAFDPERFAPDRTPDEPNAENIPLVVPTPKEPPATRRPEQTLH